MNINKVDGQPFSLSRARKGIMGLEQIDTQTVRHTVGLPLLGSGAFGMVFGLSETLVLKAIAYGDYGYETFVDIVMDRPNPHYPRIKYRGQWGQVGVYIMERLEPCDNFAAVNAIDFALSSHGPDPDEDYSDYGPHFWDAIENLIVARSNDSSLSNDIGLQNIMQRADGTVVITDPFC